MNSGFWLIMSGAYVEQELAAEFGQLPPAFLPVGSKRLYEYQLNNIGFERPLFITIPESFNVSPYDRVLLKQRGANVLPIPDDLTLGEAIVFALNLIGQGEQPLRLLHGDTLVNDISDISVDMVGASFSHESYSWAELDLHDGQIKNIKQVDAGDPLTNDQPVACGLFSFSSTTNLIRSITRARGDFIQGLIEYNQVRPLRTLPINTWHDFGHVQTFFRSRRMVSSARHFNSLIINDQTARKTSTDEPKIRAEASWYKNIPPSLSIYTARLIDSGVNNQGHFYYDTEYGYLPTLSELSVFGTLNSNAWSRIIKSCYDFLSACHAIKSDADADSIMRSLISEKTQSRLKRFSAETQFDVTVGLRYNTRPVPSLLEIAHEMTNHISYDVNRRAQIMHGDFCFSNILYDSRMQRIRVIDPRGYVAERVNSVFGDVRYDLAKLSHSIVGRYDDIIAGRYTIDWTAEGGGAIQFEDSPHHSYLVNAISEVDIGGTPVGSLEVRALTICLFLSMLPLHADRPDRQNAFIANALRLYCQLEA
jgi:hypothetical protein